MKHKFYYINKTTCFKHGYNRVEYNLLFTFLSIFQCLKSWTRGTKNGCDKIIIIYITHSIRIYFFFAVHFLGKRCASAATFPGTQVLIILFSKIISLSQNLLCTLNSRRNKKTYQSHINTRVVNQNLLTRSSSISFLTLFLWDTNKFKATFHRG